jgi:BirA family biotin operon repressor/biotin-[acetyl-CoA-carboxylase] ligase
MVLRPSADAAPGLLPILVGLAAAEALDPFVRPARVAIKWPNDLQLAGRKLAGILCEGSWDAAGGFVVAGIGINVLHAENDFPPELRDAATSLRIAAGWAPPRAEVAGAVASAIFRRLAHPPAELGGAQLDALRERDALVGRRIRVTGAESLAGTAMGITPAGALLVRTAAGALRTVRSGTVRLAEAPARAESRRPSAVPSLFRILPRRGAAALPPRLAVPSASPTPPNGPSTAVRGIDSPHEVRPGRRHAR